MSGINFGCHHHGRPSGPLSGEEVEFDRVCADVERIRRNPHLYNDRGDCFTRHHHYIRNNNSSSSSGFSWAKALGYTTGAAAIGAIATGAVLVAKKGVAGAASCVSNAFAGTKSFLSEINPFKSGSRLTRLLRR